jgi:hypothetical protein
MGYSVRYCLCHEGEIIKITRARFERFQQQGVAEFAEYPGEVLDMAELIVRLEHREPVAVVHQSYFRVKVTPEGTLDQEFADQYLAFAVTRLEPASPSSNGSVIQAGEVFRERALRAKVTWAPSPSLRRKLVDVVLGRV